MATKRKPKKPKLSRWDKITLWLDNTGWFHWLVFAGCVSLFLVTPIAVFWDWLVTFWRYWNV